MSKYSGRWADVQWLITVMYTGSWLHRRVAKRRTTR